MLPEAWSIASSRAEEHLLVSAPLQLDAWSAASAAASPGNAPPGGRLSEARRHLTAFASRNAPMVSFQLAAGLTHSPDDTTHLEEREGTLRGMG